jgi:hypothetical protein
MMQR